MRLLRIKKGINLIWHILADEMLVSNPKETIKNYFRMLMAFYFSIEKYGYVVYREWIQKFWLRNMRTLPTQRHSWSTRVTPWQGQLFSLMIIVHTKLHWWSLSNRYIFLSSLSFPNGLHWTYNNPKSYHLAVSRKNLSPTLNGPHQLISSKTNKYK